MKLALLRRLGLVVNNRRPEPAELTPLNPPASGRGSLRKPEVPPGVMLCRAAGHEALVRNCGALVYRQVSSF